VVRLDVKDPLLAVSAWQSALRIFQGASPTDALFGRAIPPTDDVHGPRRILKTLDGEGLLPKDPVSPKFERAAHERLVRSWENECAGDWILAPRESYFDEYLLFHLQRAGRIDEAGELRTNLDWLERTGKYEEARSTFAFSERSRFRSQGPWRWLNISGTGTHEIEPVQRWTAERLGREAARRHFGLITGGWPGVDHVAARGFAAELERIGGRVIDRYLLHIVEPGKKPDFRQGSVGVERDWKGAMIQRSSAVILVGGLGGTYEIGAEAKKRGRLVIALRGTGGDAEKMSLESPNPDGVLDHAIENEVHAGKIAAAAVAYAAKEASTSP
jgi:hypothetical protein